jgi:hypothetical protein
LAFYDPWIIGWLKAINKLITRDEGGSPERFDWRRKQEIINELNPWRETKTWVITNGYDTVQWTILTDGKTFIDDFCKEIKNKGYDTSVSKLSFNCDGAPWIGNEFEEHFPEIIQVLDEFHYWVDKCLSYCFEDKVASLILHVQNLQIENESEVKGHSIRWRKNRLKKMLHLRSVVFNNQYDKIKFA